MYVKTTQLEQVPLLWWQTVCENYSRGLTSPDSVSEKITEEEQSPLIRRQVVWRNYSEQMTEKQNSVKTCTKSTKKETPPIYGNQCSYNQKRKSCPCKAGMKRLKSYRMKAATCYSENSFFKSLQQQQLASCSYQRTQPLVKFLNNTCLWSDFSTQLLSKLNNFYFCKKRFTTTINPYFLLMILQSSQLILFCVRKLILYQIVVRNWKTRFLLMTLYTSLTRRTWWLM